MFAGDLLTAGSTRRGKAKTGESRAAQGRASQGFENVHGIGRYVDTK